MSLEQVQSIFPKKEIISISKIVTNSKEKGKVYTRTIHGDEQYMVPYFFELDSYGEKLFPSVYAMWDFPYFLYSFTIHQGVVSKLENGADLMLPGLIVKKPVTLHSYGKFQKGDAVAINTEDNKVWIFVLSIYSKIDFVDERKKVLPRRLQSLLVSPCFLVRTCTYLADTESA